MYHTHLPTKYHSSLEEKTKGYRYDEVRNQEEKAREESQSLCSTQAI